MMPDIVSIRMVGARRMQCKDIPDGMFLDAVRLTDPRGRWRMRWNVQERLEDAFGPIPKNLLIAKARKLIAAGKLGGCSCGCRGDYYLSEECEGYNCCETKIALLVRLSAPLTQGARRA